MTVLPVPVLLRQSIELQNLKKWVVRTFWNLQTFFIQAKAMLWAAQAPEHPRQAALPASQLLTHHRSGKLKLGQKKNNLLLSSLAWTFAFSNLSMSTALAMITETTFGQAVVGSSRLSCKGIGASLTTLRKALVVQSSNSVSSICQGGDNTVCMPCMGAIVKGLSGGHGHEDGKNSLKFHILLIPKRHLIYSLRVLGSLETIPLHIDLCELQKPCLKLWITETNS